MALLAVEVFAIITLSAFPANEVMVIVLTVLAPFTLPNKLKGEYVPDDNNNSTGPLIPQIFILDNAASKLAKFPPVPTV
ncbi:MAG: hypothetical protein BWY27_00034 [Bacteroidetes bacterium ADurb.Bin234]|nr:MAG: hypothetical protein BWY27_00034 [Bacteroidetes bacterium ADurb.Bin234]